MKNKFIQIVVAAIVIVSSASCKKEMGTTQEEETVSQEVVSAVQAIAVATSTNATDSIYLVNTCERNQVRDSIAFNSLPSGAISHLSTTYAGFTPVKAFAIKDSTGAVKGYVAVISFNGKPVGVKFDASGAFVRVLEQRERRDFNGRGWHDGGRFEDRSGHKRDTIALASLSSSITGYMNTNYAQDTLVRAFKNRDSSIVVLSANGSLFATVFNANGSFIKRIELPAKRGKHVSVEAAALPANALSYLSNTYPNYVFKYAFKLGTLTAVQGYVVFIDANATKYAVEFDASGNFVKTVTVR